MREALERIYDLLFGLKEYAILTFLIIVSLVLLSLNDNSQVKNIRSVATVVFGVGQDQLSFITRYFSLWRENELLRRVNIELADQANQLREAKLENLRLRQMVGLKEQSQYPLVGAKVIGKNLTLMRNTITLDKGKSDGVQEHMPVVSEAGLVGVVVAASDHYAVANIILNVDFRASAKIQRSRVDGILAWDGKTLLLKNIAKTLDVNVGDVVITSEYSSTYPPGIRVGIVSNVREQAGTLFKTVLIVPSVDFVKMEEIFVVTQTPDAERLELEQKAFRMLK
ncbi:MAG: rod shape-determining protein MreC [Ignavibacteriales bacterium]|nr:rod shape-determining protein MreC [Ignavibacteriales bacterium]